MMGPVLALRFEGYTIEEIAHLLAVEVSEVRQQLAADLDASPHAHLGDDAALLLHRCDALNAEAKRRANLQPSTPARTAQINQRRASVQRTADRLRQAAIARADRGQA